MDNTVSALLKQIALGEDSVLELKDVEFSGNKVIGPHKDGMADELVGTPGPGCDPGLGMWIFLTHGNLLSQSVLLRTICQLDENSLGLAVIPFFHSFGAYFIQFVKGDSDVHEPVGEPKVIRDPGKDLFERHHLEARVRDSPPEEFLVGVPEPLPEIRRGNGGPLPWWSGGPLREVGVMDQHRNGGQPVGG